MYSYRFTTTSNNRAAARCGRRDEEKRAPATYACVLALDAECEVIIELGHSACLLSRRGSRFRVVSRSAAGNLVGITTSKTHPTYGFDNGGISCMEDVPL